MERDQNWEWANAASSEIVNLHLERDEPKSVTFQKVHNVIYAALNLAEMGRKWAMLEPSNN